MLSVAGNNEHSSANAENDFELAEKWNARKSALSRKSVILWRFPSLKYVKIYDKRDKKFKQRCAFVYAETSVLVKLDAL